MSGVRIFDSNDESRRSGHKANERFAVPHRDQSNTSIVCWERRGDRRERGREKIRRGDSHTEEEWEEERKGEGKGEEAVIQKRDGKEAY